MIYELEIELEKGDGSIGLVNKIQVGLVVGSVRLKPGTYRITIERVKTDRGEIAAERPGG